MSTRLHEVASIAEAVRTAGGRPSPVAVKAGSLVYLWAPGEVPHVDQPVLARVERTTVDTIVGRDLGSKARASYGVSTLHPEGMRWTWELAAEPETPVLGTDGIRMVDRRQLSVDERREWLFGPIGSTVRINCKDGGVVVGVPVEVLVDGDHWDPQWVLVQGPTDGRGAISHRVAYDNIGTITIIGGAVAA